MKIDVNEYLTNDKYWATNESMIEAINDLNKRKPHQKELHVSTIDSLSEKKKVHQSHLSS